MGLAALPLSSLEFAGHLLVGYVVGLLAYGRVLVPVYRTKALAQPPLAELLSAVLDASRQKHKLVVPGPKVRVFRVYKGVQVFLMSLLIPRDRQLSGGHPHGVRRHPQGSLAVLQGEKVF